MQVDRISESVAIANGCRNCRGQGKWREGTVGPQTVGMEVSGRTHVCPVCDGSGLRRDSDERIVELDGEDER